MQADRRLQGQGAVVNRVRSFEIRVPDSVLDDLRNRLGRTRPARGAIKGWPAGTDPEYLASFIASWAGGYRWRDTEAALNGLPQLLVSVAGTDIHVFHIRAPASAAATAPVPLVLTHGWPSSFFEFLPVIGPLTDPAAHGADPADAFDIVIPSLPGFGFSGPLPAGQNHPARIADLWAELMDQLGYQRFGAYGGDIGSHVTNFLGARHPGRPALLDILTLYWVTNSIGTSFLYYADDARTPPLPPVTVPAGLTLTPEDAGYPREFAGRTYADIRLWRGPEPGGHFLALEQPARLVRDFYRPLRATHE